MLILSLKVIKAYTFAGLCFADMFEVEGESKEKEKKNCLFCIFTRSYGCRDGN